MFKTSLIALIAAATLAFIAPAVQAAPKPVVKATLCGETTMKGKAILFEKGCGQRLDVHVLRGCPVATYEVAINGEVVGCIITNPGGSGRLRLNRDGDSILPGDVITVGPVSGTLAGHS